MVFTAPQQYSKPGYPGQLASLDLFRISGTIPGYRNRDLAALPFGRFVIKLASGVDAVGLISAAGQTVLGVSVKNDRLYVPSGGVEGFQIGEQVDVLTMGDIWVPCEVATVRPDQPVFVRHTANGGLNVIGGVANAAGTGLEAVPGAKFKSIRYSGLATITLNIQ